MDAVTAAMIEFIRSVGLEVELGEVTESTFVPGITIRQGRLVVDVGRMRYPGDMLHEAGHLAVAVPERRRMLHLDIGQNGAEEMMAIAWSYAAALRIGIDPTIVFHPAGYRGGSDSLLANFSEGRYLSLPMLEWTGMAYGPKRAQEEGIAPYPHMLRWLRPTPPQDDFSGTAGDMPAVVGKEAGRGQAASSAQATTTTAGKQEALVPTDIIKLPYLRQVLESFQCPLQSARLLKLEARSHIHRHSDPFLGYADGEVRMHIPVQTDPEVRFYLEGERVLMQARGSTPDRTFFDDSIRRNQARPFYRWLSLRTSFDILLPLATRGACPLPAFSSIEAKTP
jgi:hypothetical protein